MSKFLHHKSRAGSLIVPLSTDQYVSACTFSREFSGMMIGCKNLVMNAAARVPVLAGNHKTGEC